MIVELLAIKKRAPVWISHKRLNLQNRVLEYVIEYIFSNLKDTVGNYSGPYVT